jgi:hypothetical protein
VPGPRRKKLRCSTADQVANPDDGIRNSCAAVPGRRPNAKPDPILSVLPTQRVVLRPTRAQLFTRASQNQPSAHDIRQQLSSQHSSDRAVSHGPDDSHRHGRPRRCRLASRHERQGRRAIRRARSTRAAAAARFRPRVARAGLWHLFL